VDRLCVLAFLHDLGKANVGFWCRQFPENDARCRYNVGYAGHIRETSPLFCDESIEPKAADALQFDMIETWGDDRFYSRRSPTTADLLVNRWASRPIRDFIHRFGVRLKTTTRSRNSLS
jgi:hypothetical protein